MMSPLRRRAADAAVKATPVSRSRLEPGIGVSGAGAGAAVTLPEAGPADRRVIWGWRRRFRGGTTHTICLMSVTHISR